MPEISHDSPQLGNSGYCLFKSSFSLLPPHILSLQIGVNFSGYRLFIDKNLELKFEINSGSAGCIRFNKLTYFQMLRMNTINIKITYRFKMGDQADIMRS